MAPREDERYTPARDVQTRIHDLELSEEDRWEQVANMRMEWEEFKIEIKKCIERIEFRSKVGYNLSKESMAKGKSPSKIARDLRRSLEKKQRKLATQEEILQKKLENQLRHDLEVVVARCAALESLVEKKDAEIKSLDRKC
ncbi:hypothetical protein QAD02_002538 [Eretmocerus hayati]|uniref:Uncharacterized protein n=1 Tax=Eretmocerus hayati TaxID=131215 RepID=A0ACC2NJH4_9HYME|nr:hypothetical protein QAD02_002538 [Eretmocerus hayati]